MPPYFGSNERWAVEKNLPAAYELGLIEEGEILCELEGASCGMAPGLLVVTDLNVSWVWRSLFGRSTRMRSVPLVDVVDAQADERSALGSTKGVLQIAFRGDADPTARRARAIERMGLGKFAALLEEDEVPLACEDAWLGMRSGRMLVTDRRVGFLMGGVLWHRRFVVSLGFKEISSVVVTDDPDGAHDARLSVHTRVLVRSGYTVHFGLDRPRAKELEQRVDALIAGEPLEVATDDLVEHLELDHITGGQDRAGQIARTIMRQKELLERRLLETPEGLRALGPAVESEPEEPTVRPIRVRLGRGVPDWVNARGGRLYLWGDDLSPKFDVMKASTERPADVPFEQSAVVSEFELYLESAMVFTRPLHIGRRWFGLRGGLTVNTGLVVE